MQTVDGAPICVSYGTADTGSGATTGGSQTHTGAEVPLWAGGPQAANLQGTHDQTDIFGVLNGLTPSNLNGGDVAPGRRSKEEAQLGRAEPMLRAPPGALSRFERTIPVPVAGR